MLNELFESAERMRNEVDEICEGTRETLNFILGSSSEKAEVNKPTEWVRLDSDLSKGVELLHTMIDKLLSDVRNSNKLLAEYKEKYADVYQKISVGELGRERKQSKWKKPIDS